MCRRGARHALQAGQSAEIIIGWNNVDRVTSLTSWAGSLVLPPDSPFCDEGSRALEESRSSVQIFDHASESHETSVGASERTWKCSSKHEADVGPRQKGVSTQARWQRFGQVRKEAEARRACASSVRGGFYSAHGSTSEHSSRKSARISSLQRDVARGGGVS